MTDTTSVVSATISASLIGSGDYSAQTHVTAPSGYFVVAGSYIYSNSDQSHTHVWANEAAHRNFSAGSADLPTQFEVFVLADKAGDLTVYGVCMPIPA